MQFIRTVPNFRFAFKAIVLPALLAGSCITKDTHAAEWIAAETPICSATGIQESPQGISDGAGGAIVTWIDLKNGSRAIYAQRVNETGQKQWATDGVAICAPLTDLYTVPQVISDGAGGAIIAWTDRRNNISGIYAQRISNSGTVLWTANGATVSANIGVRYNPKLITDNAGGAILVWRGYKNSEYNIYAQRISSTGTRQWGSVDFPIAVTAGYKEECELTTDGQGGAIMSWYDYRNGNYDIYAQRVSHAGVRQWALNGIPVCIAADDQANPRIASDGANGAIITWNDYRTASYDIYAQRVNSTGSLLWTVNGVPVCTAMGWQWLPKLVGDGAGGAIISWEDKRRGTSIIDLYAQRISSSGVKQWSPDGNLVRESVVQESHDIAPLANGGAMIAWKRSFNGYQAAVQELSPEGLGLKAPGGQVVSGQSTVQPTEILTDADERAIMLWDDSRLGSMDIFGSQVRGPSEPAAAEDWVLFE